MRKIIAITQVTLDGVMQGPGGPEEEPRNEVRRGWLGAMSYQDEAAQGHRREDRRRVRHAPRAAGPTIFAAYWPNHGDNPIEKGVRQSDEICRSRSLDRLDWQNSQRIGDVDGVKTLAASDGPELHIWGSSTLLQTLTAAELIDEYDSGSFR